MSWGSQALTLFRDGGRQDDAVELFCLLHILCDFVDVLSGFFNLNNEERFYGLWHILLAPTETRTLLTAQACTDSS